MRHPGRFVPGEAIPLVLERDSGPEPGIGPVAPIVTQKFIDHFAYQQPSRPFAANLAILEPGGLTLRCTSWLRVGRWRRLRKEGEVRGSITAANMVARSPGLFMFFPWLSSTTCTQVDPACTGPTKLQIGTWEVAGFPESGNIIYASFLFCFFGVWAQHRNYVPFFVEVEFVGPGMGQ